MAQLDTPHTPENWDAASADYASAIAPFTALYADPLIERLQLDPSCRVLEVAAGSGALTVELAPRAGSILATDFAPRMVELLRARLEAAGIGNVECAVMDGQALDVETGTFDRAICQFGLMLFPDRSCGFSELRRALRPGGRAVVSGWAGPDRFEAFGLFLAAVRRAVPDMPAPPAPPPIFSLADPAQFAGEMEAAGFADVRVDHVERSMEVEGSDELWRMLTSGAPPIKALFERLGEANIGAVREALGEVLRERFGAGAFRLSNVATVGTGTAPDRA